MTRRTSLALWIAATVIVGAIGFVLLSQGGPTSSASSSRSETTEAAGRATTATIDEPAPDAPAAGAETDAPTATPEEVQPADGTPPTSEFKRRPDGTFEPTGADQSAYPTYLGGDFDDTSPNNVESAGVDENGCDANYSGACVPPLPQRTTCEEIGQVNFDVVLGDPHGLDPDGDGIACSDDRIIRTPEGENTPPLMD